MSGQEGDSGAGAPWVAPCVMLLAFLLVGCSKEQGPAAASGPATAAAAEGAAEHAARHADPLYRCPMHPDVVRNEPGECPICGMALVKVEAEPAEATSPAAGTTVQGKPLYYRHPHDPNRTSVEPKQDEMGMDYVPVFADAAGPEVRISPAVVNNLGVRTEAAVTAAPERRTATVGYVTFDERRMRQVQPRAEGWIEGLAVRATGETVKAGQLLFTLYSPMLESVQQEYLDAQRIGNRDLIDASRDRLRALGLEAGAAERLAKSGRASGRVPFHAPIGGVVTELAVREGAMVSPDMMALTITELGNLWVIAEVPESQSGWVRAGTTAEVRLPSLPGETLAGRVEYVYPELNMETRTLRARIVLDGPGPGLRPNMLANVTLVGEAGEPAVMVARSAVIRSGREDRVVVALGDGRFAPRRVVIGPESGDRVVIREGLAEGEQVVVAGQFLLDSEANLRAGMERLGEATP
ncbi:MAG: efflux RND transporter periplasmic adaptor subunit [Steroidobacteraceae bacterium]|nr:efflux RND transporter periplasmic adaptor subunit [Steroidobacteraceae bacterium]